MSPNSIVQGGESSSPPPKKVDAPASLAYNASERMREDQTARTTVTQVTLRIVPLDAVLLHEEIEHERVARLAERLRADWFLKNPPIVAASDDKYVLLDGATRVTALRQIGCRDVVNQIVDYAMPGLTLETWNHLLVDLPVSEFLTALQDTAGLELEQMEPDHAADILARRESIATILLSDGRVVSLRAGGLPLADQARLLKLVVARYEGRSELFRVAHADLKRLLAEHARASALVVFPRFSPDEICKLALNGSKLPMGVTRHVIPGRAMRINIPLDVLQRDDSLEKKNAWLDEWIKAKTRERHVRYYQEPVFLFDE
jgi:hypothetical protein